MEKEREKGIIMAPGAFLTLGMIMALVQKIRNTADSKKKHKNHRESEQNLFFHILHTHSFITVSNSVIYNSKSNVAIPETAEKEKKQQKANGADLTTDTPAVILRE